MKTKNYYFHAVDVSANRKLGGLFATSSSKNTCPITCPFLKENGGGCYGDGGPVAVHWNALSRGERGGSFAALLERIKRLPAGVLWRHNTVGDLVSINTAAGRRMLGQLTEANAGKRGFTYTHHKRTPMARQVMRTATANGFTVNASCQSLAEADAAVAYGLRAVVVVPHDESRVAWDSPGGNRVVTCPHARRSDVKCATCKLCSSRPSNVIIAFPAHGASYKRAEQALAR